MRHYANSPFLAVLIDLVIQIDPRCCAVVVNRLCEDSCYDVLNSMYAVIKQPVVICVDLQRLHFTNLNHKPTIHKQQ